MRVRVIDPLGIARAGVEVTACTAVLRDCGVHTWQVTAPADALGHVGEGWRISIPGACSGLVTTREIGLDDGHLMVTLTGVGELVTLADALTYPVPSMPTEDQSDAAYWTVAGPAETVIRSMVDANVGPGAISARMAPRFSLAPSQGRGAQVSASVRWGNLLDEARALARAGGVTFDAIWGQGGYVLRFRTPRDLSRSVRFGGPRGGLEDLRLSTTGPTATAVIVAGQGQGEARTIRFYGSSGRSWGRRVEVFKDQRQTDDPAEHAKAGAEALAEGAAGASAAFTVSEVPGLVYGTDYLLGDRVTVAAGGMVVSEPVRQVELAWDGHGRMASLILGDHAQDDDKNPAWVQRIRALDARLRGLETI